jgi:hypothetical protein
MPSSALAKDMPREQWDGLLGEAEGSAPVVVVEADPLAGDLLVADEASGVFERLEVGCSREDELGGVVGED